MMSYSADPGGNFQSDAHRRVAAILVNLEPEGQPLSTDDVMARIADDPNLNIGYDEAGQIISELVAVGAAVSTEEGRYGLTAEGAAAFPSPHASDGGPVFHA